MKEMPIDQACPACRSNDVPKLIVRGTGKGSHGTSLLCRRCGKRVVRRAILEQPGFLIGPEWRDCITRRGSGRREGARTEVDR